MTRKLTDVEYVADLDILTHRVDIMLREYPDMDERLKKTMLELKAAATEEPFIRIKVNSGEYVLLDKDDVEMFASKTWYYYDGCLQTYLGDGRYMRLHHAVLPGNHRIGFINKNSLDCRKCNLKTLKPTRKWPEERRRTGGL